MRPLLRTSKKGVEAAENSVATRAIMDEKKALQKVREALVEEAKTAMMKKQCLKDIENAMHEYQKCELEVLRTYAQSANDYPTSWTTFLKTKKDCVNRFAESTAMCNKKYLWE